MRCTSPRIVSWLITESKTNQCIPFIFFNSSISSQTLRETKLITDCCLKCISVCVSLDELHGNLGTQRGKCYFGLLVWVFRTMDMFC